MMAKCVGCGASWNISLYAKIPKSGYICPHCESRIRAGETLDEIKARPQGRAQRKERHHAKD